MEPKELRIGLRVKQGTIELLEVRKSGIVCIRTENGTYSEVEPEPITEELLLKFGFEKDERSGNHIQVWYYGENPLTFDYMIRIKNIGDGFFYQNGHFKIKYVHQLQNLYFALTNEELEINF